MTSVSFCITHNSTTILQNFVLENEMSEQSYVPDSALCLWVTGGSELHEVAAVVM